MNTETIIFQSTLFDNVADAHAACASAWLTANGKNSRDYVLEALDAQTDEEIAKECNEGWDMESSDWFDMGELVRAFADIRECPAKELGWDERWWED